MKFQKNKMKKKFNWQLLWAFVLIGYGIYSTYAAIGLKKISEFAFGVCLGQASVFIIWGMRELFGSLDKKELKGGRKHG